jgi:hypothetical protein
MDRRTTVRAQVDLPLSVHVDGFWHPCRALDLSTSGLVAELSPRLGARELVGLPALELRLGEGRPVRARARPVWARGRLTAVRFVLIHDVDRLTIAEHMDQLTRQRSWALH